MKNESRRGLPSRVAANGAVTCNVTTCSSSALSVERAFWLWRAGVRAYSSPLITDCANLDRYGDLSIVLYIESEPLRALLIAASDATLLEKFVSWL